VTLFFFASFHPFFSLCASFSLLLYLISPQAEGSTVSRFLSHSSRISKRPNLRTDLKPIFLSARPRAPTCARGPPPPAHHVVPSPCLGCRSERLTDLRLPPLSSPNARRTSPVDFYPPPPPPPRIHARYCSLSVRVVTGHFFCVKFVGSDSLATRTGVAALLRSSVFLSLMLFTLFLTLLHATLFFSVVLPPSFKIMRRGLAPS